MVWQVSLLRVYKLIPLSALCKFKNDTDSWYDWQSQSCVAEGWVIDPVPQIKIIGSIGHSQLWAFCSSKGYRSYYDHGFSLQCGYQDWVEGQAEGDYYDYHDICRYAYSTDAFAYDYNSCVLSE